MGPDTSSQAGDVYPGAPFSDLQQFADFVDELGAHLQALAEHGDGLRKEIAALKREIQQVQAGQKELLDLQARTMKALDSGLQGLRPAAEAAASSARGGEAAWKALPPWAPQAGVVGGFVVVALLAWVWIAGGDRSQGWADKLWQDNRAGLSACVTEALQKRSEITCSVRVQP